MVVETRDQAEMRTRLRRLREAGVDGSMIRIDTLCGRPGVPTTYRLSRFVVEGGVGVREPSDLCHGAVTMPAGWSPPPPPQRRQAR
ncbi:hypothetical protein EF919_39825 [Streptomyces sp. WAC02707]|nr:hypothetical protein EF919_39825 [Streptomyces sp. WAC02707]